MLIITSTMNKMAFSSHLENVPRQTYCLCCIPWYFRHRLWHLRGKLGWITLYGLVDHFLIHMSILCLVFYCNSFRIIPGLTLIYLLNIFLRWVCTTSPLFADRELRPTEIDLKSSELVPSHSSFLMFLHLHETTQKFLAW